jgi:hypothetical protein
MEESIGINGRLDWVLFDEHGIKKESGTTNQIQTDHKRIIAMRMSAATAVATYTHMWVGTGALGGVGVTDVTTPVAGGRQAITSSTPGASTVVVVATLAAGVGTGTLTCAGMFNTNTALVGMMCGATIAVTKAAGDSLTLTWTVTFS